MREKLNENPMIQAAVLGVLAIVVGFLLFTRMSGPKPGPGPGLPATDPAAAVAPGTDAAATGAPTTDQAPGGDATQAPGGNATPPPTPDAPTGGDGFVAGPGLPEDVAAAYKADKVIALLVIREHPQNCFKSADKACAGLDDQRLEQMVGALRSRSDTAVFITHAYRLAHYSRIAAGVDIDRTPALLVIQPKRLTQGPLPVASVSYGFRGKDSVDQTIRDALYDGHTNLPYYP